MTSLTLHARGDATPDEAWERYAVPARWPEWAPQIRRVTCDAGRIAPGVTGTVHGIGGLALVSFTIEDVDEAARRWTWRVAAGPVRLRLHHGVLAAGGAGDRRSGGGAGARTWLTIDGPLPIVVGYAPIARLALRRLTAG